MKNLFLIAPAALLATQAFGFDEEMYTTAPVPRAEAKSMTLGINHSFLTKIVEDGKLAEELSEKNFGFSGANVALTAQWVPVNNVTVRGLIGSRDGLGQFGASGFYSMDFLSAELGADLVMHRDGEEYMKSAFAFVGLGSPQLFKDYSVDLTLNGAYDSYNAVAAAGIGLGYNFTQEHRLMAEYFPRISGVDNDMEEVGEKNTFDFGYRYHSFGHQFFVLVTNSAATNMRQAVLGTDSNNLGLAFRVNREM
jgi:hypothetical protein